MKLWQYLTIVILGLVCVGLSVAVVATSKRNTKLQSTIQLRQEQLNSGIMGQQAQQITGNIFRDMTAAAVGNEKMRELLSKHDYAVPARPGPPRLEEPVVAEIPADPKTTTPEEPAQEEE